jgi:hypothetical protein
VEDFIMTIEKNIKSKTESKRDLKNRELLKIIFNADDPDIRVDNNVSEGGDVNFSVNREDIGLSVDVFLKYKKQILNPYIASSIGELLVRENVGEFVVFLTDIEADDYHYVVNGYRHDHFGVEVSGDVLIFSFHISLIQSILTEDLKSG